MAPVFWLEITDWKKESARDNVSNQYVERCFSTDGKNDKIYTNSYKSLKYFDNEADFDVNKIQSKFVDVVDEMIKYDHSEVFNNYIRLLSFLPNKIVSTRSVISRVMNTPFEINSDKRKWIIRAETIREDSIYLYFDNDSEDNLTEGMAKQYELLKRYLFHKIPIKYHRKVISKFNEFFGELIVSKFVNYDLCYLSETPGLISDQEITNHQQLKEADHIYCDIFDAKEFSQDVINYNPVWWSNATLINAKQCILGAYDKDNDCLKEIIKFDMDKFQDKTKYENLWSPDAAWNFLNDFLQFVKDVVNSVSGDVKNKCVWKFQSFPDKKPLVSCEILLRSTENGKETLSALPNKYL